MAEPFVIVKFYKNFRMEEKANAGLKVTAAIVEVEEEVFYREWELLIQAAAGDYIIHVFNDGKFIPPASDSPTGDIAWNAAAAAIESALNAVSEIDPGHIWTWEVVELEPGKYRLRVFAIVVSGNPIFPNLSTDGSGLSGHLVPAYDEVSYRVPLEFGCSFEDPPGTEVFSEGSGSGAKPSDRPVTGSNA